MASQEGSKECCSKISSLFRGKRFQDSSCSWVVCIAAAICNAVNLGFLLSFGILFPALMAYFDETRERTAFVGSAALGMTWFASPLPGYLCDRFGCRITTFLGGVLCVTGLVSTSLAQSLNMMYFTHGLVFGLGTCFLYNSCFLVTAQYFKQKLSLATGVVAVGSSVGVIYTGPLLQVLLDSLGWRDTFRIIAAYFALVCILSLTFNPNVQETTTVETFNKKKEEEDNEKSGISLYCSVWTFPTFTVVVLALMFGGFGMYIPVIYLVTYCEDVGITTQKASRLFIVIGLVSSFGKLVSGSLCNDNRVNPVYMYQASMLFAGLSVLLLPFATKYWELISLSTVYGLSEGISITTQCFVLLSCVDGKKRTAAFCINNILYSLTMAAGGPVAGLIMDKTGNYVYSFYMTGGVLLTSFLIPMMLIIIHRGRSRVHTMVMEEA